MHAEHASGRQADATIAARDAALPGLGLLLEPERLAEALRAARPDETVRDLHIGYLRYKPGTSCVAALHWLDADGRKRLAHAKALPPARYAEVLARPRWRLGRGPRDGAMQALHGHATLVCAPTQDRDLKGLRALFDGARQPALLAALGLPEGLQLAEAEAPDAAASEPALLRPSLLRHKPGRRLVLRLGAADDPAATLLRVCRPADTPAAALGARLGAIAGGPALRGADTARGLIAVAWQPGEPMCPEARDAAPAAAALRELGERVAALHALDAAPWDAAMQACGRLRTRADEVAALRAAAVGLAELDPTRGVRALRLAARLASALEGLAWRPVPIHGDLSIDQAVAGDGRVWLVDWDRAALGDAAADLGSLRARLELQVIEGTVGAAQRDAMLAALCGSDTPTLRLDAASELHAAAGLLMLAVEPFRRRLPDWPQVVDGLLGRCAALLDAAPRGVGAAVSRSVGRETGPVAGREPATDTGTAAAAAAGDQPAETPPPGDPALPWLDEALDTAAVEPALLAALGLSPRAARLASARLLRHKPGRRGLVEFRLEPRSSARGDAAATAAASPASLPLTAIGKLRARGLDARSFRLHQTLRERGFDGQGGAGPVRVPAPLGLLPSLRLWLQRHEAGQPCTGLFAPGAPAALPGRIAEALAALHRLGPGGDRQWRVADEMAVLRLRLADAARLLPALAARIEALAEACASLAGQLAAREADPRTPRCGIHRDFHPDQVLVDGAQIVLLDFDCYCVGDPALDAGNFLAHLRELAWRRHGDGAGLAPSEAAFAEAFLARSAGTTPEALADWTTLALARHVSISRAFPERHHTTEALLAQCEARLSTRLRTSLPA